MNQKFKNILFILCSFLIFCGLSFIPTVKVYAAEGSVSSNLTSDEALQHWYSSFADNGYIVDPFYLQNISGTTEITNLAPNLDPSKVGYPERLQDDYNNGDITYNTYIAELTNYFIDNNVDFDIVSDAVFEAACKSSGIFFATAYPYGQVASLYSTYNNFKNIGNFNANNQKLIENGGVYWAVYQGNWIMLADVSLQSNGIDSSGFAFFGLAYYDLNTFNGLFNGGNAVLRIFDNNNMAMQWPYSYFSSFGSLGSGGYVNFYSDNHATLYNSGNLNNGGGYASFFVSPDDNPRTVPIFYNFNSYLNYINGSNNIIVSENLKDFTPEQAEQIDYSRLYEKLSNDIRNNDDKNAAAIQNIISTVIGNELMRVNQQLSDINNSLYDSETGMAWLRRIYMLLDERLQFDNWGGSSDYTEQLSDIDLHLIEIKNLLAIDSGIPDLPDDPEISDLIDLISLLAESKFPFSIVSDINILFALVDVPPTEPNFEIPYDIYGVSGNFAIDLSFWDNAKPYFDGFIIFSFICALLFFSFKLIDLWKD